MFVVSVLCVLLVSPCLATREGLLDNVPPEYKEAAEDFQTLLYEKLAQRLEEKAQLDPIPETFANVRPQCARDMAVISAAKGNPNNHTWVLQLINADARGTFPPIGGFLGNPVAIGSYDLCFKVKATHEKVYDNTTYVGTHDFNTHYCRATYRWADFMTGFSEGWCVPESCNRDDVTAMMEDQADTLKYAYCGTKKPISTNPGAIIALVITSFFLALVAVASIVDGLKTWFEEEKQKELSKFETQPTEKGRINAACDVPQTDLRRRDINRVENGTNHMSNSGEIKKPTTTTSKPSAAYRALLSFSLFRTLPVVLQTGGARSKYKSLNGLRVIAMTWIVLGHSWQLGLYVITDGKTVFASNFFQQFELQSRFGQKIITSMDLSVDIFFFIGATLVTLSFMKTLERLRHVGTLGRVKAMGLYVFHRYWRLTPVLAALMMIVGNLWSYLGSGPLFPEVFKNVEECKTAFWVNLLYIQNFYNGSGTCMGWTWYLANDFQFFLIAPVFALALFVSPFFGPILLFLGWGGSIAARSVLITGQIEGSNYFWDIYVKPWCRFGPYALGIAMGHIMYKTRAAKVKMNTLLALFGWLVATFVGMLVVFGTYKRGECEGCLQWSQPEVESFTILKRDGLVLCVAWVVFACINGYGGLINTFLSWDLFNPLSKLSYCCYLIHPVVHMFALASRQKEMYVQDITMIYMYLGTMVLTLGVSLMMTVVFEVPFLALEKIILPSRSNGNRGPARQDPIPPSQTQGSSSQSEGPHSRPALNSADQKTQL